MLKRLLAQSIAMLMVLTAGHAQESNNSDGLTREEFAAYLSALEAHDYETLTSYYAADVRMHMADGSVLDRDGIVSMERALAEIFDSTIDVVRVVIGDDAIALHAIEQGTFLRDAPEFAGPAGSPKAGERWMWSFVMFYTLRDGKIAELRAGPIERRRL